MAYDQAERLQALPDYLEALGAVTRISVFRRIPIGNRYLTGAESIKDLPYGSGKPPIDGSPKASPPFLRHLTSEQFEEVREALYKYDTLLFRNATLTPEQQYALTKVFDPTSQNYGHGNNKTEGTAKSILHPDLKTIPRVPQVQLIGNGTVYDHEGLAEAKLKHPSHTTFHKTSVCRYDDGTGDVLTVPLGTTAFAAGKTMWALLPPELKSVAVRARVRYAPHPYVWMGPVHAKSTGLGLECEGLEEAKLKTLPVVRNTPSLHPRLAPRTTLTRMVFVALEEPSDGRVGVRVHPCGAAGLLIESLPEGEVRDLLNTMQRPAIVPHVRSLLPLSSAPTNGSPSFPPEARLPVKAVDMAEIQEDTSLSPVTSCDWTCKLR
ncbi:hypothetical protein B0H14DRAFT_3454068 [Mycena olivaceomarginata]|nr:hypothetical protein B0H14DRAFT_3454068 [Mycena olivaceomarginata]